MERGKVNLFLKEERQKRKIEIEDIVEQTRIPSKYIEMIEQGRWDEFPSSIHLKGYLKKYCECLGFSKNEIEEILTFFSEKEEKEDEENHDEVSDKGKREKSTVIILSIVFFILYFFTYYLLSTIQVNL